MILKSIARAIIVFASQNMTQSYGAGNRLPQADQVRLFARGIFQQRGEIPARRNNQDQLEEPLPLEAPNEPEHRVENLDQKEPEEIEDDSSQTSETQSTVGDLDKSEETDTIAKKDDYPPLPVLYPDQKLRDSNEDSKIPKVFCPAPMKIENNSMPTARTEIKDGKVCKKCDRIKSEIEEIEKNSLPAGDIPQLPVDNETSDRIVSADEGRKPLGDLSYKPKASSEGGKVSGSTQKKNGIPLGFLWRRRKKKKRPPWRPY